MNIRDTVIGRSSFYDLAGDGAVSVPCEFGPLVGTRSMVQADVTLLVEYEYPLPWATTIHGFRFVAQPGADGLRFLPQPLQLEEALKVARGQTFAGDEFAASQPGAEPSQK